MTRPGLVPERPEGGAATVVAVGLLGLLLVVGCALAAVGAIFAAHRTAQAAADLAALAGAASIAQPGASGGDPCSLAASTAQANDARLTGCVVTGREVRVTVAVTGPEWQSAVAGDLVAESRAGPASTVDGS